MKRLLHTPLALLVWRIALLYAALMLCRAAFWVYNAALLGPPVWSELGQLVAGSLKFDTASVVYADGVFILLSLLPLPLRERRWYRGMLFWYYVIVNAVLIAAANLADTVYFRYTQKRFTADEIFFADNDNSLQLAGKFMAENWYLVLLWAGLVALLAWGYRRRTHEESVFSRGWAYYAGGTAVFALAAGLSVAGMRGGMTRMTRPITLSNAMLYTADSGKANLILSNPFCILRTIGSAGSVKYRKYFTPEELPQRFTPVHRPADSAAVDLTGRNVMIFIMESMSAEHSAFLHPELYADLPEKGFTPFLDSLMRNGLTFKRMYANGSRSIQAMPSVLGSIPSFRTPFVLMPQSLGESRQLPEGYTRIHKGVAYDDRAFRLFFQRFGGEEWFRRTIFVFVADHVSSEKFAEETRSYPGNMHVIGFIYTPDGALRGEVGEITQQLDIMPTLLGLTGNRKPYFAFGRDVLNEPQRPRWSVSYDGRFRALTGEGAIVLDDSDMDVQECPATPAADSLAQNFRALVQQYYTHIEKKSYTAND